MKQIQITAPFKDIELVNGGHLVRMKAEETRTLPGFFAEQATKAGCKVEEAGTNPVPKAPAAPAEPDPELTKQHVAELVKVIGEIMDTGDKSLLTASGEPRVAELQKRLDFDITADERTAAWDEFNGA